MQTLRHALFPALCLAVVFLEAGCQTRPRSGSRLKRTGDEIIVAGQFFHTGTRVVTWLDPGAYDAYRVERRFSLWKEAGWENSKQTVKDLSTPNRFGLRESVLSPEQVERVRGGGWDLGLLQDVVDQFVLHYDASGTSRQCFKVLHDLRGLSVHFLLDLDGTIYQTLDVKERAWHATIANSRSVGIEIANIGAYSTRMPLRSTPLGEWYASDAQGRKHLVIPARFSPPGHGSSNLCVGPARAEPVRGVVQGQELQQYDFTPEQYRALICLTATLCQALPKIRCDYPRDPEGRLIPHKLSEEQWRAFQGVLGHFHVQQNKQDPGPAFQWDYLIEQARRRIARTTHPSAVYSAGGNARMRALFPPQP